MIKKLITIILALAALGYGGILLWFSIQAKIKYDRAREDKSLANTYAVTPIGQGMSDFLADIQSNWSSRTMELKNPFSEGLQAPGMAPSVANLIYVFNFQMPPYEWLSPKRNREASCISLIKATLMPISMDKRIYVSADHHLGFIRCGPTVVYVHQDDPGGMRVTMYYKPREGGGKDADTTSRPASTQPQLIEFALSTPEYFDNWNQLSGSLNAAGLREIEGPVDLGTFSLMINSSDFQKARDVAVDQIIKDSLTIRIKKAADSDEFEVWEKGKKVREESYEIKKK